MPRMIRLLSFASPVLLAFAPRLGATPASSRVSTGELTGMQLLYAVNNDQFDFNDAYTVDNSAGIAAGSFPRVAYYVELGPVGNTSWVWVSMDTFNANPARVGVPKAGTGIVENGTLVSRLNVESNHPGVAPGIGLEGIIEFWASNYTATGAGAFGSNDGLYDWKDSGGTTTAGHGSFQVFAFTNPGKTAARTLFGITANGGSGIGDQPGNPPGASPDWTFGSGTGTYAVRNLEIWVGDNRNGTPAILGLDGDILTYTPGVDGARRLDQGAVAGATDPQPFGLNGWSNGTLRVKITAGGVAGDDVLAILHEGSGAGQIGFNGSQVSYEGAVIGAATGGAGGADLLVTFNPTATTLMVSNLLNNITYANANPGTSPMSRQIAIQLTDGDGASSTTANVQVNLNVGGAVGTLVWEGDESTDFHTPGNWDGNAVPDANDTAIFRNLGAVVNLGAGATVGEIRFDGTASFSLSGGPLVAQRIHQAAAATGTNQVNCAVQAVGLTGTVDGGRLVLGNLSNAFTGVFTVSGGTLQATVLNLQSGLGLADVNLDGGNLDLRGVPQSLNGLHHYGYQPVTNPVDADLDLNNNGGLMGGVAAPGGKPRLGPGFTRRALFTDGPAARGLDFDNDADFINTGVITRGDQYASLFLGTLTVTPANAGNWTFRRNASDDGVGIWLDLNQNGVFESTTPGLGSNRGEQLQWNTDAAAKTVNLAAGNYQIAFTHREGVGGALIDMRLSTPNLAEEIVKPTDPDQAGFFSVVENSAGTLGNTVRVASDGSRIVTDALMTLNRLDVSASLGLQVAGEGVAFLNTQLAGTLTITEIDKAPMALGNVTGSGGLVQLGNGILRLTSPNTYAGPTTVRGGILRAEASGAFGLPGQGTVVHTNASLQVSNGTQAEPLEIRGAGTADSDGALNKMIGQNVFWTGRITVPTTARIFSEGNELFLDGGIDITGTSLAIDAQNRVNLRMAGVTGAPGTTLRVEGNDRIDLEVASPAFLGDLEIYNDGYVDAQVSGALGDGAGVTRLVGNEATLLFRNTCTHAENLQITGDGRGANTGAIRMENGTTLLNGSITLTGDAMIVTRNTSLSTLTVNGPVQGGFVLTQRENATLSLKQDSAIPLFNLELGGTIRIATAGGLGGTKRLVLDASETLELEGNLLFDGSTLNSLVLNGGAINSLSGKSILDIPVTASATAGFQFGGNGDLDILQSLGNGNAPVPVPGALSIFGFHFDNINLALNLDQNGGMVNGVPPNPTGASALGYFGQSYLTDGPGGRGLDFDTDADFQATGVIATNRNDQYCALFIGYLNVSPAESGTWQFQRIADDDQIGIWLDVDGDGKFESTPTGLGSDRGEQLQWDGDAGVKSRALAAGRYLFAVTHHEAAGGSQAHVQFKSPRMGTLANIKPSDPNQAGMWEPLAGVPAGIPAANALAKSGGGVLSLFADNPFNQPVTLTGGTLVAAHDGALGTSPDLFARNATLALSNGIVVAGKTLRASGLQTPVLLTSLDGDNSFLGNVVVGEIPSLRFSTSAAASRLTVGTAGAHSLALGASRLTLDGPGEVVLNSDVGNAHGVTQYNAIRHYGYHVRNDAIALNLHNNGGMMGGGNPTTFQNYYGQGLVTIGPGGRGLNYLTDQDFQNDGVIALTQNDNYSDLFLGYLTVSPAQAGVWEFRRGNDDDNMGIWLDLDRDGIFESTTAGLGSDRGEQLQYDNDAATKSVTLAAGTYLFAVTHAEGGGGSVLQVLFKSPTMPAQVTINPGDPAQAGIWQLTFNSEDEVVKQGTGTALLAGNNTHVGPTSVRAGTLVVASANALGATSDPTRVLGGTLAFAADTVYNTPETIELSGNGATNQVAALVSLGGLTTIGPQPVIVANPIVPEISVGTDAGTFTVQADLDLQNALLRVAGNGDTELSGVVSGLGSGSPALSYAQEVLSDAPVLYYRFEETGGTNVVNSGTAGTNFNGRVFDPTHTTLGAPGANAALGTAAAFDNHANTGISTPFSVNGFGNAFTIEAWVLSPAPQDNRSGIAGQNDAYEFGMANATSIEMWNPGAGAFLTPYASGAWFHVASTGNGARRVVYINGVPVTTNTFTAADYGNSAFFFNIGGLGIHDPTGNGFNGSLDEVALYDRALSSADVQRHYAARANLEADNRLVKQGQGTLRLSAGNTYAGGSRVTSGMLLANGSSATGTGPTRVEDGGALGGTGVVGGAASIEERGKLNPGVGAGTLTFSSGLTFTNLSSLLQVDLRGAGPGAHDRLVVNGNTALNGASLDLQLGGGYVPAANDALVILSQSSGSVGGTFNGLPEGSLLSAQGAEFVIHYTASSVTLTATGGRRVYAGPDRVTRSPSQPVSIPLAQLLANDRLGAGTTLSVVSVASPGLEGGGVALVGDTVVYTPPPGYEGNDSFLYTVADGVHTAQGLVTVVAAESGVGAPAESDLAGLSVLPNGDYHVTFTGTPGATYEVQWTVDITPPATWTTLGTVTADPTGLIAIDHASPPQPRVYYRVESR